MTEELASGSQNPEAHPTSAISQNDLIDESKVERIVGSTVENGIKKYRVRWQFFSAEHDTWEPLTKLNKCKNLIEEYENKSKMPKREKPKIRTKTKDTSFFMERINVANRNSVEFAPLPTSPSKTKKGKSKGSKISKSSSSDYIEPQDTEKIKCEPYDPKSNRSTQMPNVLDKKSIHKYRYLSYYAVPSEFWQYKEFFNPGESSAIQLGISNRNKNIPDQVYKSDRVCQILGIRNNQGKREVNVFWATSEVETWIPLEIMREMDPQLLVDFLLESWKDIN